MKNEQQLEELMVTIKTLVSVNKTMKLPIERMLAYNRDIIPLLVSYAEVALGISYESIVKDVISEGENE